MEATIFFEVPLVGACATDRELCYKRGLEFLAENFPDISITKENPVMYSVVINGSVDALSALEARLKKANLGTVAISKPGMFRSAS